MEKVFRVVESGSVDKLSKLIEQGLPESWVIEKDDFGQMVLHRAAELGNLEVLRLLVEQLQGSTADAKVCDENGGTVLHYACLGENDSAVAYLLSTFPELESAGDSAGNLPIHLASRDGHLGIVSMLKTTVNSPNGGGQTPLHIAVSNNRREIVAHLLASGADVSQRDKFGKTPIDIAAQRELLDLIPILKGK